MRDFILKYRFYPTFPYFPHILLKIIFLYGNRAGMTLHHCRILSKVNLILETASKVHFGPQTDFFNFATSLFVQFSSITHFLSHKIQDPSSRRCSYGPHGPFLFSVKNGRDMEKRYQKNTNGKKTLFEIIRKMN